MSIDRPVRVGANVTSWIIDLRICEFSVAARANRGGSNVLPTVRMLPCLFLLGVVTSVMLLLRFDHVLNNVLDESNLAGVLTLMGVAFLVARTIDLLSTYAMARTVSIQRLELRIGLGLLIPYPYLRIANDHGTKVDFASDRQAATLIAGPTIQLSMALVVLSLSWLVPVSWVPALFSLGLMCTGDALMVGLNPFVNSKGSHAVGLITNQPRLRELVIRYWRESLRVIWLRCDGRWDVLGSMDIVTRSYLIATAWIRVLALVAVFAWVYLRELDWGSLAAVTGLALWMWPAFIQELVLGLDAVRCQRPVQLSFAKRIAALVLVVFCVKCGEHWMSPPDLQRTDVASMLLATPVRAPASGFVCDMRVVPGQSVMAGDLLGRIRNPDWESERDRLQAMMASIAQEREPFNATEPEGIAQLRLELKRIEDRIARASIRATVTGRVFNTDLSRVQLAYVEAGTELIHLIPLESDTRVR